MQQHLPGQDFGAANEALLLITCYMCPACSRWSGLVISTDAAVISKVHNLQLYMEIIHKQANQGWAVFLPTAISLYRSSKSTQRTAQGTTRGCVCERVPGSLALIATLGTPTVPSGLDIVY